MRAVDTATHPDYQGRGIFSRLTLHAIDELRADGVAFVFNTPNDQSRPGYLKMGWQPVARLPVLFRPRSIGSLLAVARARVPAEKWSLPTDAGAAGPRRAGRSRRSRGSPAALRRGRPAADAPNAGVHGLALRVRAARVSRDARRGAARRRDRRLPAPPPRRGRRGRGVRRRRSRRAAVSGLGCLLRKLLRVSRADYAVRIGGRHAARAGSYPLPGQGPTLVWRSVSDTVMAHADEWRLGLGDVELF